MLLSTFIWNYEQNLYQNIKDFSQNYSIEGMGKSKNGQYLCLWIIKMRLRLLVSPHHRLGCYELWVVQLKRGFSFLGIFTGLIILFPLRDPTQTIAGHISSSHFCKIWIFFHGLKILQWKYCEEGKKNHTLPELIIKYLHTETLAGDSGVTNRHCLIVRGSRAKKVRNHPGVPLPHREPQTEIPQT